jgi:transcriptional regulator of acetoin/glycerol metabolism
MNGMVSKARDPGQTTVGASRGNDRSSSGTTLAVRWLFPATDGPVTLLSGPAVVVGRGQDCGTVLPGAEISRNHAELYRNGPLTILRDMGSRNGSFVNGQRVREAPLGLRDVVRLGEWIGVVMEISSSDPAMLGFGTIAPGLYGGPKLRAAVSPALRVAKSDLPIVLEGETGTGKEVVARAIHAESGRRGMYLAVNCAALPEALAEGELFGYRRGAFTGAERANPGHFRAADGGTLLLDEICDLPLVLQAKILRVIEQHEVLSLGESQPIRIDTRVVAAAQGSLERAVAEKTFRADLYARLDGLTVTLPPLRERIEDVPYLFARLLHEGSGGRPPAVDPLLVEQLCLHDWPLNVRELGTLVRRLLVLRGHEECLKLEHLPSRLRQTLRGQGSSAVVPQPPHEDPPGPASGAEVDRDDFDYARLVNALRRHAGNMSRAAADTGMSRQRAYRLIQARQDLDLDEMRQADADRGEG